MGEISTANFRSFRGGEFFGLASAMQTERAERSLPSDAFMSFEYFEYFALLIAKHAKRFSYRVVVVFAQFFCPTINSFECLSAFRSFS